MRILVNDGAIEALKAWARGVPADHPSHRAARALLAGIEATEDDMGASDRDEIIAAAERLFCERSDNDVEIDDDAVFSRGDDGVWVSAWVHVAHAELSPDADDGEGGGGSTE